MDMGKLHDPHGLGMSMSMFIFIFTPGITSPRGIFEYLRDTVIAAGNIAALLL
jgi:hypothetical protein